jgi:hypothetical protein
MTSGPAGLIVYNTTPVDHPHGQNGYTLATYVWTPSRDEIGLSTQATFKTTTQSGGVTAVSVSFTVQDVPPNTISGFVATNELQYDRRPLEPKCNRRSPHVIR